MQEVSYYGKAGHLLTNNCILVFSSGLVGLCLCLLACVRCTLSKVRHLVWCAGIFGDLSGPRSTVEAVGVLAAIVGIHECGHFIAARAQGIRVTKFSIGFGPPLLSYQVQASCSVLLLIMSERSHQDVGPSMLGIRAD